ncbi:LpxI family protein [Acuticoccus sp.]|uniref:LpxI family protein n=1 Tax=Acuticoccus sp. TaxID=1904378 RepID=UPI003B51716F
MSAGPLAILAGAGALPWEAASALAARRPVVVFAVEGEADDGPPGVETHRVGYGEVGRLRRLILERGCGEVLMLGAIRARPDYARILGDVDTLKLLPRLLRAAIGGDDAIVRKVIALFEEEGVRVVSVAEAVPELMAPAGALGRHRPREDHLADIDVGARFLEAAASFDVGQAAVVVAGRVVAVEAAEGTDAMLARCAELRRARRFAGARGAGVLVKRAKEGQDMRADVPAVGAATLAGVVAAGLGGMALEAGRTVLAERAAMIAAADRAGAFVIAR